MPLPLLPEVMVIQLTSLEALQKHPPVAFTFIVPVPPVEVKDWLEEERE